MFRPHLCHGMSWHGRMKVLQDKELLTELREDILVIALEMVSGSAGEGGMWHVEDVQFSF